MASQGQELYAMGLNDEMENEYGDDVIITDSIITIKGKAKEVISDFNLYLAMNHDVEVYFTKIGQTTERRVSDKFGRTFYGLERALKKLAKAKRPRLPIKKFDSGLKQVLAKGFGELFLNMPHYISLYSPHFHYSEHIEAGFEFAQKFGFMADGAFGFSCLFTRVVNSVEVELFNDFLQSLCDYFKTRKFKKKLRSRKNNAARIQSSIILLVDSLLVRHPRLNVVRLDVEYKRPDDAGPADPLYSDEHPNSFLIEVVKKDLQRFFNNIRDKEVSKHLVGYAWKLEFGEGRGYHVHIIFFFDGDKVRNGWFLGRQMGEYWKHYTDERGTYFNCNQSLSRYKKIGIGMIRHDDEEAIQNLYVAANYLAKEDQHLQVKTGTKCHVFGRSELPTSKPDNRGAPRKSRLGRKPAIEATTHEFQELMSSKLRQQERGERVGHAYAMREQQKRARLQKARPLKPTRASTAMTRPRGMLSLQSDGADLVSEAPSESPSQEPIALGDA